MNAKEEFLEHISGKPKVLCAVIKKLNANYKFSHLATIYEGYTKQEWEEFLETLNSYDYDDSWGTQELDGTIWFEDGTYSDRGEYDGSEWWEYHKPPQKPVRNNK